MNITVAGPMTVRFQAQSETALLIRRLDDEGYLGSLGLRPGDVIVGTADADFDGERPASTILRGLMMARNDNRLKILRNGQPLEVSVESRRFTMLFHDMSILEPIER